ncbi:hypothetical protein QJS10_CPB15g01437 [Acorus calamus]|uniref:Uncharacterized protein n=1 Tax=Acorus calamus TaxID=4465 RepID=A0AAV9D566_ACOCL|nr:hypothetical protein QJS10_CPB15g01437 [Acorus calamus]
MRRHLKVLSTMKIIVDPDWDYECSYNDFVEAVWQHHGSPGSQMQKKLMQDERELREIYPGMDYPISWELDLYMYARYMAAEENTSVEQALLDIKNQRIMELEKGYLLGCVCHLSVRELWDADAALRQRSGPGHQAVVARSVIPAGAWVIWHTRNAAVFKGEWVYIENMKAEVLALIRDWARELAGVRGARLHGGVQVVVP